MRFRRRFLRKMRPVQLAFDCFIVCKIFLSSLTLCNTSSFLIRSVQLIFSILLQHHIQNFPGIFDLLSFTLLLNQETESGQFSSVRLSIWYTVTPTYLVSHLRNFPHTYYIKLGAQIRTYDAADIFELLWAHEQEFSLDHVFDIRKKSVLADAEESKEKTVVFSRWLRCL
jgi:hypothetical protein